MEMNKIQSVNIINLKRREDLREAQTKNWMDVGFSEDEIVFHDAIDGLNYKRKEELHQEAIADGFDFFQYYYDEGFLGLGEFACMWSIARLLRHIMNQSDGLHIYCLADRYSKKHRDELESIFAQLPDLKFFQFRGFIYKEDEPNLTPGMLEAVQNRKPVECIEIPGHPKVKIEKGNLKLGDGIIAMTPNGARWMQEFCQNRDDSAHFVPNIPYEVVFLMKSYMIEEPGIYSTCDVLDQRYRESGFYTHGRHTNPWEAQYDYESLLGKSDIALVNRRTGTGDYGHEAWREVMEEKMENSQTSEASQEPKPLESSESENSQTPEASLDWNTGRKRLQGIPIRPSKEITQIPDAQRRGGGSPF